MIPKFRAWLKKEKRMIPVDILDLKNKKVHWLLELEDKNYWFDYIVLMQSTGLKDKNGKEIFERDIVKYEGCDTLFQVVYELGAWTLVGLRNDDIPYDKLPRCNEDDEWWGCQCDNVVSLFELVWNQEMPYEGYLDFEIVGNMYENPELLECDN